MSTSWKRKPVFEVPAAKLLGWDMWYGGHLSGIDPLDGVAMEELEWATERAEAKWSLKLHNTERSRIWTITHPRDSAPYTQSEINMLGFLRLLRPDMIFGAEELLLVNISQVWVLCRLFNGLAKKWRAAIYKCYVARQLDWPDEADAQHIRQRFRLIPGAGRPILSTFDPVGWFNLLEKPHRLGMTLSAVDPTQDLIAVSRDNTRTLELATPQRKEELLVFRELGGGCERCFNSGTLRLSQTHPKGPKLTLCNCSSNLTG